MKPRPKFMEHPDKYEIATEVLSSAIRVLQAAGFYEAEILQLFDQVAKKKRRLPIWLAPLRDDPPQPVSRGPESIPGDIAISKMP
jgi:hypothetical protein